MSGARWSPATWETLLSSIFRLDHVSFLPHKIFRWDQHGIYRDCFFPVTCHHLFGAPITSRCSIGVSQHGKDDCGHCASFSLSVRGVGVYYGSLSGWESSDFGLSR